MPMIIDSIGNSAGEHAKKDFEDAVGPHCLCANDEGILRTPNDHKFGILIGA